MTFPSKHTIAAIATPLGAGGVGIIRISGPESAAILAMVTGRSPESLRDRYFEYGHVQQDGLRLDEVLFVLMRGPRSFTGEDVAEIHGHGGAANLSELLRCIIAAGARHAEAGEFTRRAFENRRIDLIAAEAIADIVNASSAKALRVAQEQLAGKLGTVVAALSSQVVELRAEIEAGIDFPEDAVSPAEQERQQEAVSDAARHCGELASSFGIGQVLRDGAVVVLSGAVNAGKSSLFNALIGRKRSIVAAEAGTTRDYVEAEVVWHGLALTLVDTAGLRESLSSIGAVEDQGIELGKERADRADLQLLVVDDDEMREVDARQMVVHSKCDLRADCVLNVKQGIRTSVQTGEGLESLKKQIIDRLTSGAVESAEGCVVTNERQRSRLEATAGFLSVAAKLIETRQPAELIIVELNAAQHSLAEISGEEVGEEMLDALFSRFCIGK